MALTAEQVSAQVTATNAYVTHLQGAADAAIAKLTDAATAWSMNTLTAVNAISLTALTTAAGTKPALTTLTLPTYTPAVLTSLASPNLPAVPSMATGTAPIWSDAFWTDLKGKVGAFVDTIANSDGVDAVVAKLSSETGALQVALYAKEYERKTQTLRDLYSAAEANTGAKGFTYPNSMTTALKLDAQQKLQFDLSQTSRDLIAHIFDWAKSNWQFSVQQGVAIHNADAEFNLKYLDTTLRVYQAQVGALLEKYRSDISGVISQAEVRVKEYAALYENELRKQTVLKDIQLKDASFDVEVAKTNASIITEGDRTRLLDFQARVADFLETAKANMAVLDNNVKNKISAASAAAQACSSLATAAGNVTVTTLAG